MDVYKLELSDIKNKMKDIDFSRTVRLKDGAKDFLEESSWKEDSELFDGIEMEDFK